MKIKKILIAAVLSVMFLCACAKGEETKNENEVYVGEGLSVILAEALTEVKHSENEWVESTYESILKDNDMIFKCTINSIEEVFINVNGKNMGYMTYLEVTPKKVYKDTGATIVYNKPIKVVIQTSTREYESMSYDLAVGRQCVFVAKSPQSVQGEIDYSKFCDAVVTIPVEGIIPIVSNKVYVVRDTYRELLEPSEDYIDLREIIDISYSESDISTMLFREEELPEFFVSVKFKDQYEMRVAGQELLWSFVNKSYENEEGFSNDIATLSLTSESMFAEYITEYVGNTEQ